MNDDRHLQPGTQAMKLPTLFATVCALSAVAATPSAVRAEDTAPSSIVFYFEPGSATIRPQDEAQLDKASRTYRDGNPIVMIVTGSTDNTGSPKANLTLSERRANAVVNGLVARGIPVQRLQVLGKGVSDPAVVDANSGPDERNRRAEITWR
jgi:outer membrane protein OmpA-like peptidoglycan-associated protein